MNIAPSLGEKLLHGYACRICTGNMSVTLKLPAADCANAYLTGAPLALPEETGSVASSSRHLILGEGGRIGPDLWYLAQRDYPPAPVSLMPPGFHTALTGSSGITCSSSS